MGRKVSKKRVQGSKELFAVGDPEKSGVSEVPRTSGPAWPKTSEIVKDFWGRRTSLEHTLVVDIWPPGGGEPFRLSEVEARLSIVEYDGAFYTFRGGLHSMLNSKEVWILDWSQKYSFGPVDVSQKEGRWWMADFLAFARQVKVILEWEVCRRNEFPSVAKDYEKGGVLSWPVSKSVL